MGAPARLHGAQPTIALATGWRREFNWRYGGDSADALPFFAILADGKLVGRVRGLMKTDAFAAYLRKTMAGGR